ncbi:MmgE/PrpD family protein [Cupriavidus basilensis]|uniref:MmgE/PrpD family protein n=1 Tax=Cupriavidus basilensis TaxID=68895 RepID=UPI0007511704|nr:MmgE/PrpD family protein [Cupriavidus basilensis]
MHIDHPPLLLPRIAGDAQRKFDQLLGADGLPPEVLHAARNSLLDWLGVCLGARRDPQAVVITNTARLWSSHGAAWWLSGGRSAAPVAAWVNGSLSHVLDYDDTHVDAILHGSGPLWATLLALGQQYRLPENRLIAAFAVGLQTGARLGMQGRGERLTAHGWHVTPVLGRIAAALAGALALRLDASKASHAVALAATQAGGLAASFGTPAKPLHAGYAALDAVMSVELASQGCEGAPGVLDGPRGLLQSLLQDEALAIDVDLDGAWEISRISFKPYASCQLTHAAIDAARALHASLDTDGVEQVIAYVHPLAIRIAGSADAHTATQAKFSLPYCIALGLAGHTGRASDFERTRLGDPTVQALSQRVALVPDPAATRSSARLELHAASGRTLEHAVTAGYGSVAWPMRWNDLRAKFLDLAEPVLGAHAASLADAVAGFGRASSLDAITSLIGQGDMA